MISGVFLRSCYYSHVCGDSSITGNCLHSGFSKESKNFVRIMQNTDEVESVISKPVTNFLLCNGNGIYFLSILVNRIWWMQPTKVGILNYNLRQGILIYWWRWGTESCFLNVWRFRWHGLGRVLKDTTVTHFFRTDYKGILNEHRLNIEDELLYWYL